MNKKIKNKSNQSGFIDLILMIVAGLLLMRHYNMTASDVIEWVKSISLDDVMAWLKDFVEWCKDLLDSVLK